MNDSPEYRKQCEARLVLKWPKAQRENHYEGVEENRGKKARLDLMAEVKKQYRLREAEQGISL